LTGSDWHDPFAVDDYARERERRRAEREAQRRGTQSSLGEKVSEQTAEQPPTGEQTAVPASDGRPPAAAVPAPRHPPPTPDPGFEWTDSPRRREPVDGGGGVPPQLLWFRRALGLIAAVALVAIVGYAFAKVVDGIGGGDEQPAGPAQLKVGEVLIPEGLDRRQIADEVKGEVKGDYLEATKKAPKGFPIDKYAPDGASSLEGFLFPATYELEKGASAGDLVDRQLDAFRDNIKAVDMSYAESKNLNVYDVLKIASMIEREIAVPKERKLASAVIYNRLAAGDTLGIDATIRYYLENYDEQLTESELDDPDNPYNTRVIPGLPPTPIGNPGLASIKAAANPAKSDAYYFVIKPGTCNEHTFVATTEEFEQAQASYQAALEAQGGSPTAC
jgi:hypothetical protein